MTKVPEPANGSTTGVVGSHTEARIAAAARVGRSEAPTVSVRHERLCSGSPLVSMLSVTVS